MIHLCYDLLLPSVEAEHFVHQYQLCVLNTSIFVHGAGLDLTQCSVNRCTWTRFSWMTMSPDSSWHEPS